MKTNNLILLAGLSTMLMASACTPDMSTPSEVNTSKIKVKDQIVTASVSTDHVDTKQVVSISRVVLRDGAREVTMTIPYIQGGAVAAEDLGIAYKNAFAAHGVTNFSVALVPVRDSEDADQAVVSYQAVVAHAADECGRIPGYQGTESMKNFDSYQYGCEMQTNMARMVNDPSDLLGQESPQDGESRRYGAIIDPYPAGTPNQPLKGVSASSISKSQ